MNELEKIALETIELKKQAFIFLPSRSSAEKTAEDISKLTNFNYPELEQDVLHALSTPTKQCRRLSHCIRKGIAFHHSGLTNQQKETIEEEFRKGTIKIICCTPTLAAGLSMPAFRVVIKSLKRYSERWGMDWIPVLEYLQMSGRAGRPEYETFGEAITIAKDNAEKEEIYEKYICGVPEKIYSKLAVEPVLRTYLLSLISSGLITNETNMKDFFAKTFWAKQFQDWEELNSIMNRMLQLLQGWQFVVSSKPLASSDFISANALVNKNNMDKKNLNKNNSSSALPEKKLSPSLLGRRVSELYLDPLTAKNILERLSNFTDKNGEIKNDEMKKTAFSLLQMVTHTLEMRPLLKVKAKEEDNIQRELLQRGELFLEKEPNYSDMDYDEFLNSFKTALFLEEWIEERDEDYLLEKYDVRPGEIHVKLEVADWLLYSAEELAKIMDQKEAVKEIAKLRIRLKYGVKEELLPLLKVKGIGRIRARKLYFNGIKDLGDLKKIELVSLGQIIGKAVAEEVKKQLGEEVPEIISEHKRKGQMSLGKY